MGDVCRWPLFVQIDADYDLYTLPSTVLLVIHSCFFLFSYPGR